MPNTFRLQVVINEKSDENAKQKFIQNFEQYIVQDFYGALKENEGVLSYPHFRAYIICDENDSVISDAILEKPKNRKKWKYSLHWMETYKTITLMKYVTPFRATAKNRMLFNKKSRHLAKKMIVLIEKSRKTTFSAK